MSMFWIFTDIMRTSLNYLQYRDRIRYKQHWITVHDFAVEIS